MRRQIVCKMKFYTAYKAANIWFIAIFKKQHYFKYDTVYILHSKNLNKSNLISNKKAKEKEKLQKFPKDSNFILFLKMEHHTEKISNTQKNSSVMITWIVKNKLCILRKWVIERLLSQGILKHSLVNIKLRQMILSHPQKQDVIIKIWLTVTWVIIKILTASLWKTWAIVLQVGPRGHLRLDYHRWWTAGRVKESGGARRGGLGQQNSLAASAVFQEPSGQPHSRPPAAYQFWLFTWLLQGIKKGIK